MLVTISGCGFNGFSQLDGFKCLNFDESGKIVYNKNCSSIRTEQNNNVVSPEVLVQSNGEYDLDNIMFTWSRIAVTLKKGDENYMSVITGFVKRNALDKGEPCGAAVILDKLSITATSDMDILLTDLRSPFPYKILHEKDPELLQCSINNPNNAAVFQIICGGHRDFFAVYDSMSFGKLCSVNSQTVKDTCARYDMDKELIFLELHPIDSGIKATEISCGKEHVLILSQFGTVYSYGIGSRGQLGHCSVEPESTPKLIAALEGVIMKKVCAGGWHSASISEFGDLYMWGWNESGQLGMSKDGSGSHSADEWVGLQAEPRCVTLPDDLNVSTVACGSRHTVLLTETARIFTCGWNAYGQLGLGNTENKDRFTEIVTINGICVNVFAGQWNSMFVCIANKPQLISYKVIYCVKFVLTANIQIR